MVSTEGDSVEVSLAKFEVYPTSEPFTTPDAEVDSWAELSVPGSAEVSILPPALAVVPPNLEPGVYIAYLSEDILISSLPITVTS
jgi:hypothetical protein